MSRGKGSLLEFARWAGITMLCTVTTLSVQECRRRDAEYEAHKEWGQGMLKRIDQRFDQIEVGVVALYSWAEKASPKLRVDPPMQIPKENESPLMRRYSPGPAEAGIYAQELPDP